MVEALVTASPEFFKDKTNREIRAYFAHTLKFFRGQAAPGYLSLCRHSYGRENAPSASLFCAPDAGGRTAGRGGGGTHTRSSPASSFTVCGIPVPPIS